MEIITLKWKKEADGDRAHNQLKEKKIFKAGEEEEETFLLNKIFMTFKY
jgi:hypothetical protein